MPSLSRTRTFFTAFLALCFGIVLCPSIHASDVFVPVPNAFVDGQRHYIFGGSNGSTFNADPVMIDLTVSWNTSSPVVKRLSNLNARTFLATSTLLPNGNIFTLSFGNGYIYDVRTESWMIEITNLPFGSWYLAVSDMETGLVYVPDTVTHVTKRAMLEVDLKTKTITKRKPIPGPSLVSLAFGAWSAPLRSIIFIAKITHMLYTYTPSKLDGTSDGWGTMETTGASLQTNGSTITCFVPAHNGSTMVLMVRDGLYQMTVYVLDIETRTWKSGPLYSATIDYVTNACSVSGDQLISYGPVIKNGEASDYSISVYNMEMEKWVTTYTPPPPQQTSTSLAQSNRKVVVTIVIVTGAILAIILTAIATYIGATKRSKSRTQGISSDGPPDSPDIRRDITTSGEVLSKGVSGLCNLVDAGINSKQETPGRAAKPRLNIFTRFSRSHQGSFEAHGDTGHPHAVVEEPATGRNVQEGSPETRSIPQHPHTNFMDFISHHPHAIVMDTSSQHPHVNAMDASMYNDKEELMDSTMHVMEELRSTAVIHNDKAEWNEE
ncbi:hypothetical protein B0O80DRAFT_495090 [Mortierella sp. GBAus27b]|nr:hypothetical protein B0O80DRAFT_495090 [Mortierella sp. GBAus27b]